jgi:hypothetical protein
MPKIFELWALEWAVFTVTEKYTLFANLGYNKEIFLIFSRL